jgi:hypothetical protein
MSAKTKEHRVVEVSVMGTCSRREVARERASQVGATRGLE